jgi:hypothetical protein
MSETNSAIAVIEDSAVSAAALSNEIANLSRGQVNVWSAVTPGDHLSKIAILDAMGNSVPLQDNTGKTIQLVNAVVQQIEMADEKTGEMKAQPRITLIDVDGSSYHVISNVVFKDLKNFFGVLGMPSTWPAPLPVAAEKGGTGQRQFITVKIAKGSPTAK